MEIRAFRCYLKGRVSLSALLNDGYALRVHCVGEGDRHASCHIQYGLGPQPRSVVVILTKGEHYLPSVSFGCCSPLGCISKVELDYFFILPTPIVVAGRQLSAFRGSKNSCPFLSIITIGAFVQGFDFISASSSIATLLQWQEIQSTICHCTPQTCGTPKIFVILVDSIHDTCRLFFS